MAATVSSLVIAATVNIAVTAAPTITAKIWLADHSSRNSEDSLPLSTHCAETSSGGFESHSVDYILSTATITTFAGSILAFISNHLSY